MNELRQVAETCREDVRRRTRQILDQPLEVPEAGVVLRGDHEVPALPAGEE